MYDERIRELESLYQAEYQRVRDQLKKVGLNHRAYDTLREHFDELLIIPVEFTLIDALAIMAAAEGAQVPPDIIIEHVVRKELPSGYYLRGAQDLLRQLKATADVVGTLDAQGIPYQALSPAQMKEMVQRSMAKIPREFPASKH